MERKGKEKKRERERERVLCLKCLLNACALFRSLRNLWSSHHLAVENPGDFHSFRLDLFLALVCSFSELANSGREFHQILLKSRHASTYTTTLISLSAMDVEARGLCVCAVGE